MEFLHAYAGSIPIEIGGKTYSFAPPTLSDFAELHGMIVADCEAAREKVGAFIATLPPAMQATALREAIELAAKPVQVTGADVQAFCMTQRGTLAQFWLQLRKHHPEFRTIEDAAQLAETIPYVELTTIVDRASRGHEPKNSPPPGETSPAPTPPAATPPASQEKITGKRSSG